jgi:hypothetical protein
MTREEAAQQLTFEKAWMDEHGFISDWIGEAYEMAIAALLMRCRRNSRNAAS